MNFAKGDEFLSVFLVDFSKSEDQNRFSRLGRNDFYRLGRNNLEDLKENNSINSSENSSMNAGDDSMKLDGNDSQNPNVQGSMSPSKNDARNPNENYPMIKVENALPDPNAYGSMNPDKNKWQGLDGNNVMELDENDSDASRTSRESLRSSSSVQSEGIATPSLPAEVASPDVYVGETATLRQSSRESASPEVQFLGIRRRGRPRKTPLSAVQSGGVAKREAQPRKVAPALKDSLISSWCFKV